MNLSLPAKIGLSILSGVGVGFLQFSDADFSELGGDLTAYVLSGLLFAAGVLIPHLERDKSSYLRAVILIVASAASYRSAVWLALDSGIGGEFEWIAFVVASIAGATIVLTALVLVTPIRASLSFVVLGLLAGIIGGPVTYFTLPANEMLVILGHASWHTLICLAICFGAPSTSKSSP
jgi:hypothetical protein